MNIALHCDIEFETDVPLQTNMQFQKLNKREKLIIELEIDKLLEKKVIEEVSFTPGQFISPIFTHPKKDGKYGMILNLLDTHYSVPMAREVRKILRFMWKVKIFEYRSLPNGIACAPKIFY